MLIHSASQLLTLTGSPQRGNELGRLNIITDGAVIIRGDTIVAVGKTSELQAAYPDEERLDAGGRVVMPGFVDPHTHAVWAGDRAAEFEMRLQGRTYLEILAAGGGILSTVKATRQASLEDLVDQTRPRLDTMFRYGTTTAEVKPGYGLETTAELNQLEALLRLDAIGPIEVVPTFLGAHAVPPEYQAKPDEFTDVIVNEMLPAVRQWWLTRAPDMPLPFVDVFCEKGVFSVEQTRRIFTAAQGVGFPLKIHADEFENLGGVQLAVEFGAISADHLVKTSSNDIQALAHSDTVAVALPCTPFGLAETQYTPVAEILKAGGIVAIASDLNPGTAWCENMQFVIALACRYLHMTPAQAIAAATINAAAAIGRSGLIGSLAVGKQADLLILSVDDYRHLGYRFGGNLVNLVIKSGKVYSTAFPSFTNEEF